MNIHSLLSARKRVISYTDLFRKLLLCFHSRFLMVSLLKTPDSRRCITSDPIALLRFVYFHIRIRILTLLSSLYMMKAVPTGFLFHQLRIIWSFQLCRFCVQWNPLLSIFPRVSLLKLPLTAFSSFSSGVSLVGKSFLSPQPTISPDLD